MTDFARGRPARLAFLIGDGPDSNEMLDAAFAFSQGVWGGRFALMVPCLNGQISEAFWTFLELHDPDIVYSFVPLSETLQSQLHERIYPSELIEHRGIGRGTAAPPFRVELSLPLLPTISMLPFVLASPFRRANRLGIVDRWHTAPNDRFLLDNFGFFSAAKGGWSRLRDAASLWWPVYFAPAESFGDPRSSPIVGEDDHFGNAFTLFSRLKRESIVSLGQLSMRQARQLDYRDMRWHDHFVIIIGDSAHDRIAFWNLIHLMPEWRDGDVTMLRMSREALLDADLRPLLLDFIRSHNRSETGNSPGVRKLVSLSLDAVELERLRKMILEEDRSGPCVCERHESLDSLTPSPDATRRQLELHHRDIDLATTGSWVPFHRAGDDIPIPACPPVHLDLVSPEHSGIRKGWWVVDCDLQRTHSLSQYDNQPDRWRLPRRLRMHSAFSETVRAEETYTSVALEPRVTRRGLLSVYASARQSPFVLREPQDSECFRIALLAARSRPTRTDVPAASPDKQIAAHVRPSDKAGYLDGILHICGGLQPAVNVFLNEFWSARFAQLGASSAPDDQVVSQVANRMSKRLRGSLVNEIDSDELRRLAASAALQEVRAERRAPMYLPFERIEAAFENYRTEYNARHPAAVSGQDDADWTAHERSMFIQSLQSFCASRLLHQGYDWTCPECLFRNWAAIDRFARKLTCEVCGEHLLAPVDKHWHFRLNEFVLHAVRDQGTTPLLWALHELQEQSQTHSLYFLGPTELFLERPRGQPDAEIDLLVVVGGEVVLCEVKSSDRDIDVSKTASIARRVRPDRVVLAVMSAETQRLQRRISELRNHLQETPIRIQLLTRPGDKEYGRGLWLPILTLSP